MNQLFFRRDPVLNELLEDQPPFAFAAYQPEKNKRARHPVAQHQRVVLMPTGYDKTEGWPLRQRLFQKFFPIIDAELCSRRKILRVGQCRAVVENRDAHAVGEQ